MWNDHQQFFLSQVFVDPEVLIGLPEFVVEVEAQRLLGRQTPHLGSTAEGGRGPEERAWSAFGSSGRNGGVTVAGREAQWSPLALWVAEQIRLGIRPITLPPLTELLPSIYRSKHVDYRFGFFTQLFSGPRDSHPPTIDDLSWQDAFKLLNRLTAAYPSVPWTMSQQHIDDTARFHEQVAREAIVTTAKVRSQKPPTKNSPLIPGTFHEALREYYQHRKAYFTKAGEFDGSGHHMLGMIDNFQNRQPDVPLAMLDFTRCLEIYDFWKNRPLNLRTKGPLSKKHCASHVGELRRFFIWLHTSDKFAWRRPEDFDLIETKVKRLPSDRRSIQDIDLKTFSVEHLKLIYKHAMPAQRLKLLWCLNCSHGAAEIGRVEWEDLFLNQRHPWTSEGLKFDSDDDDSWCGLLRPKTDVVGWWLLWPETVQLTEWWNAELQQRLKRELKPAERMLLTNTGANLYRDSSRNAQTSFSNEWRRLLSRVVKAEGKGAVPSLPFGTLRDQFSNWLGSEQNRAVLASVALAHGIPHKGDKLLFKHYSNRPWAHLFEAQKDYRQHLQPMFDDVPDPLVIHDPLTSKIMDHWNAGTRDVRVIAKECEVHSTTVRQKLKDCGLA
ncbi:hypothetical protein [Rosistilla ulvae]|uniref:hypothetical protein n=1 Tax=Rosistilla ulvae TaxID=1930277 RepID=UPI0011A331BA|nr:hypothetical protein [Rosistilla ulvae]